MLLSLRQLRSSSLFIIEHRHYSMISRATMDPYNTPAMRPPPGVIPNFDNPVTRNSEMYTGVEVTIAFTTIFILLRFYCKLTVSRLWGWDDRMLTYLRNFLLADSSAVACTLSWVNECTSISTGFWKTDRRVERLQLLPMTYWFC